MSRSKIKAAIEHNSYLRKLIPLARKMGLLHLLHLYDDKKDRKSWTAEDERKIMAFYDRHRNQFKKLYDLLEDDFSRKTLQQVMEYRKTRRLSALKDIVILPQYFQEDIFSLVDNEVFVDGGAYIGDTVDSFIKDFVRGGTYKKEYAWEPDESNRKALAKNLAKFDNIIVVPFGMWNEKTELNFLENGNGTSQFSDADTMSKVLVNTIDNVCSEEKVTFIKMDIEGSEMNALNGAINIIKRDRPRLAVCIYHSLDDLYRIPLWIKETVPEYKLYIRHHSDSQSETVVYATI